MMLTITTNSFENDVLHADKPVLVDFWAQWCPYCRRIAPAFDKVGEQYADTLTAGILKTPSLSPTRASGAKCPRRCPIRKPRC